MTSNAEDVSCASSVRAATLPASRPPRSFDLGHAAIGVLITSGVIALFNAAPVTAGLDLTWRAPVTSGGDSIMTLDCANPDSVAILYGCFQSPDSISEFIGLEILLDIVAEGDTLPAFWRLEGGGCNSTGLSFSSAKPLPDDPKAPSPWDDGAPMVSGFMASSSYVDANRFRIAAATVRSADNPMRLERGKNYFGFQLRIFSDNSVESGGHCPGCTTPVTITWSKATLIRKPSMTGVTGVPGLPDLVVTSSGLGSACVRLNGARFSPCQPLPGPPEPGNSGNTEER